jgi:type II secretory pathway pseudopilin PulG
MTLIEGLAALAICSMVTVVAAGVFGRLTQQSSTRALVTTFQSLLAEATTRAVTERNTVGVVFEENERGCYGRLYRDGDFDGINREDITAGVDLPISSSVYLRAGFAFAGLPPSVTADPLGNPISGDEGARFGRGDILSFTPLGNATPGSLYLRDLRGEEAWAFRVAGLGGRVRVFHWWKGRWQQSQ